MTKRTFTTKRSGGTGMQRGERKYPPTEEQRAARRANALVSINISTWLRDALRDFAEAHDTSIREVAERAIWELLEDEGVDMWKASQPASQWWKSAR